jgi:hypothetical protein
VNSRFPNLVIQNNVDGAVRAGEFDPALICDLSNADNMLGAACRARHHAAVRAHADSSMPHARKYNENDPAEQRHLIIPWPWQARADAHVGLFKPEDEMCR